MKQKLLLVVIFVAILAGGYWLVTDRSKPGATENNSTRQTSNNGATSSFNKQQFSLTNPASIWLVVNKQRPLSPKTYTPANLVVPNIPLRLASNNEEMHLRSDAAAALEQMAAAAKNEAGLNFMLASGYRSYNFQVNLYNGYVKSQGQAVADTQSARAGYSEHQTGLAADLEPASRTCEVAQCFANTPEGRWLAANAYRFGFIIRYPADKQSVTGYEYEPWHVRYVGTSLSNETHKDSVETLEEFFGLPAAPDYN